MDHIVHSHVFSWCSLQQSASRPCSRHLVRITTCSWHDGNGDVFGHHPTTCSSSKCLFQNTECIWISCKHHGIWHWQTHATFQTCHCCHHHAGAGHPSHAGGFGGAAVAVVHARPVHACGHHHGHAGGFSGAAVAVVHVGICDYHPHSRGSQNANRMHCKRRKPEHLLTHKLFHLVERDFFNGPLAVFGRLDGGFSPCMAVEMDHIVHSHVFSWCSLQQPAARPCSRHLARITTCSWHDGYGDVLSHHPTTCSSSKCLFQNTECIWISCKHHGIWHWQTHATFQTCHCCHHHAGAGHPSHAGGFGGAAVAVVHARPVHACGHHHGHAGGFSRAAVAVVHVGICDYHPHSRGSQNANRMHRKRRKPEHLLTDKLVHLVERNFFNGPLAVFGRLDGGFSPCMAVEMDHIVHSHVFSWCSLQQPAARPCSRHLARITTCPWHDGNGDVLSHHPTTCSSSKCLFQNTECIWISCKHHGIWHWQTHATFQTCHCCHHHAGAGHPSHAGGFGGAAVTVVHARPVHACGHHHGHAGGFSGAAVAVVHVGICDYHPHSRGSQNANRMHCKRRKPEHLLTDKLVHLVERDFFNVPLAVFGRLDGGFSPCMAVEMDHIVHSHVFSWCSLQQSAARPCSRHLARITTCSWHDGNGDVLSHHPTTCSSSKCLFQNTECIWISCKHHGIWHWQTHATFQTCHCCHHHAGAGHPSHAGGFGGAAVTVVHARPVHACGHHHGHAGGFSGAAVAVVHVGICDYHPHSRRGQNANRMHCERRKPEHLLTDKLVHLVVRDFFNGPLAVFGRLDGGFSPCMAVEMDHIVHSHVFSWCSLQQPAARPCSRHLARITTCSWHDGDGDVLSHHPTTCSSSKCLFQNTECIWISCKHHGIWHWQTHATFQTCHCCHHHTGAGHPSHAGGFGGAAVAVVHARPVHACGHHHGHAGGFSGAAVAVVHVGICDYHPHSRGSQNANRMHRKRRKPEHLLTDKLVHLVVRDFFNGPLAVFGSLDGGFSPCMAVEMDHIVHSHVFSWCSLQQSAARPCSRHLARITTCSWHDGNGDVLSHHPTTCSSSKCLFQNTECIWISCKHHGIWHWQTHATFQTCHCCHHHAGAGHPSHAGGFGGAAVTVVHARPVHACGHHHGHAGGFSGAAVAVVHVGICDYHPHSRRGQNANRMHCERRKPEHLLTDKLVHLVVRDFFNGPLAAFGRLDGGFSPCMAVEMDHIVHSHVFSWCSLQQPAARPCSRHLARITTCSWHDGDGDVLSHHPTTCSSSKCLFQNTECIWISCKHHGIWHWQTHATFQTCHCCHHHTGAGHPSHAGGFGGAAVAVVHARPVHACGHHHGHAGGFSGAAVAVVHVGICDYHPHSRGSQNANRMHRKRRKPEHLLTDKLVHLVVRDFFNGPLAVFGSLDGGFSPCMAVEMDHIVHSHVFSWCSLQQSASRPCSRHLARITTCSWHDGNGDVFGHHPTTCSSSKCLFQNTECIWISCKHHGIWHWQTHATFQTCHCCHHHAGAGHPSHAGGFGGAAVAVVHARPVHACGHHHGHAGGFSGAAVAVVHVGICDYHPHSRGSQNANRMHCKRRKPEHLLTHKLVHLVVRDFFNGPLAVFGRLDGGFSPCMAVEMDHIVHSHGFSWCSLQQSASRPCSRHLARITTCSWHDGNGDVLSHHPTTCSSSKCLFQNTECIWISCKHHGIWHWQTHATFQTCHCCHHHAGAGHPSHAGGFGGAAVAVVHARPVHACGHHHGHAGGFSGAAVAVVHVGICDYHPHSRRGQNANRMHCERRKPEHLLTDKLVHLVERDFFNGPLAVFGRLDGGFSPCMAVEMDHIVHSHVFSWCSLQQSAARPCSRHLARITTCSWHDGNGDVLSHHPTTCSSSKCLFQNTECIWISCKHHGIWHWQTHATFQTCHCCHHHAGAGHPSHAGGFGGAAVAVVHARPVHACGHHHGHAGGFSGAAVAVVHVGICDYQLHSRRSQNANRMHCERRKPEHLLTHKLFHLVERDFFNGPLAVFGRLDGGFSPCIAIEMDHIVHSHVFSWCSLQQSAARPCSRHLARITTCSWNVVEIWGDPSGPPFVGTNQVNHDWKLQRAASIQKK